MDDKVCRVLWDPTISTNTSPSWPPYLSPIAISPLVVMYPEIPGQDAYQATVGYDPGERAPGEYTGMVHFPWILCIPTVASATLAHTDYFDFRTRALVEHNRHANLTRCTDLDPCANLTGFCIHLCSAKFRTIMSATILWAVERCSNLRNLEIEHCGPNYSTCQYDRYRTLEATTATDGEALEPGFRANSEHLEMALYWLRTALDRLARPQALERLSVTIITSHDHANLPEYEDDEAVKFGGF